MQSRIIQEIELLKSQFLDLRHGDKFDWALIQELRLPPERFNRSRVMILFVIPVGYPQTGPDNFFTDADLRLKEGPMPPAFSRGSQSSSGTAPIEGNWGWFSWHSQSWRPAAMIEGGDNLLTFVRGIKLCLRGEESG